MLPQCRRQNGCPYEGPQQGSIVMLRKAVKTNSATNSPGCFVCVCVCARSKVRKHETIQPLKIVKQTLLYPNKLLFLFSAAVCYNCMNDQASSTGRKLSGRGSQACVESFYLAFACPYHAAAESGRFSIFVPPGHDKPRRWPSTRCCAYFLPSRYHKAPFPLSRMLAIRSDFLRAGCLVVHSN